MSVTPFNAQLGDEVHVFGRWGWSVTGIERIEGQAVRFMVTDKRQQSRFKHLLVDPGKVRFRHPEVVLTDRKKRPKR